MKLSNILINHSILHKEKNCVYTYHSMHRHCYATGEYTMTVSEQQLGKHVPVETNTHITVDLLWKRGIFYVVCAEMLWAGQSEVSSSVQFSYVREAEKRLCYS
jgi:hypothetical protein